MLDKDIAFLVKKLLQARLQLIFYASETLNLWRVLYVIRIPKLAIFSGVVAKMLDCDIIESEFEFQSRYCVHTWTNVPQLWIK